MADEETSLPGKLDPRSIEANVAASIQQTFAAASTVMGFATKSDLQQLDTNLRNEIGRLDTKIDKVEANLITQVNKIESNLNEKIDKVEANLDGKIDKVEQKVDALGSRMLYVGIAMITACIATAKFSSNP
jgi:hypothetical protein